MKPLFAKLKKGVDGAQLFLRLARRSRLVSALGLGGVIELARAVANGALNTSIVYRIHARRTPNAPAVIWRDRITTWAEIDRRIDGFASALERRGVGRGRSVILFMANRPELVELSAAASRCGARAVSVVASTTAHELVRAAIGSEARAIVIAADLLSTLDAARPDLPAELLANVLVVGGDAPASMSSLDALLSEPPRKRKHERAEPSSIVTYTSGTTGTRKGAVRKLKEGTILTTLRFFAETPMRAGDVHLVAGPLARTSTFAFAAYSQLLGCAVVLADDDGAEEFLRLIDRHRVTTTFVTPTTLPRVLALPAAVSRRYDTRSLRAIFDANTALTARATTEAMDRFGDVIFTLFGSTETGFITFASPEDLRASPATIGRALPGNEIRLLGEDGRDVRVGQVGELFVKGAFTAEYLDASEGGATNRRDGFVSTRDLARQDESGRYFFEGRKRDVVRVGGKTVYPMQVQAILEQHPGVDEASVVGAPDGEGGQRVRAFIAKRAGADVDEPALHAFARQRLEGAMLPSDIVIVDRIPRNSAGKVLKHELRERRDAGTFRKDEQ